MMVLAAVLVLAQIAEESPMNPEGAEMDARIGFVRETNTVFSMTPFDSREVWEVYAEDLRRTTLIACGLFPMPERTPLNPRITGRCEREGYVIENVAIEAYPGFFVTGNLYRPDGPGPFPAVACPHGHWEHGRLENTETCSVAARCITFARMGAVAFSYDMIGYNDSRVFDHGFECLGTENARRLKLWGIHPVRAPALVEPAGGGLSRAPAVRGSGADRVVPGPRAGAPRRLRFARWTPGSRWGRR